MNGCYHYLLFLTVLSSLEATISVTLPNVTIQHVCEHDVLFIKCPNANEAIQVVRSMYGRTSQRICNDDLTNQVFYKTCANIEQSKHQTKLRCQKKSTCQLLVDNSLYTDPCGPTVPKHFEIHYRCLRYDEICAQLFQNCSRSKDLRCVEKVQDEYTCRCPPTICAFDAYDHLTGFVELACASEHFQGIPWPKTLVNKGQQMPCPSPCTGQISRACQLDGQWGEPNYGNCQCPSTALDQSSAHRSAQRYSFQCNFWLINRLLPEDNACAFGADENDNGSATCLFRAFEQMSSTSCSSFAVDFQNLGFEVFVPTRNQSRIRLSTFPSGQIIVDKSDNAYTDLPMLLVDAKDSSAAMKSLMLAEQPLRLTSVQTANVTVIFNHRSSELRYQCRAYRSTDASFQFDSSDMFFACQLSCSNGSHTICQCPFYNPFMRYVLHLDTSTPRDDFELLMIDNDLQNRCSIDREGQSLEQLLSKLDRHVRRLSSFEHKKGLVRKLIWFIDTLIGNEAHWKSDPWNTARRIIEQLETIGSHALDIRETFVSITNYLELFVNAEPMENTDRSVIVSTATGVNSTLLVLSKLDEYLNKQQGTRRLNSPIVYLNVKPGLPDNLQITFRHLTLQNQTNQMSTCVALEHTEHGVRWTTDGCRLIASNLTHSVCSCVHRSVLAVLTHAQPLSSKSAANLHEHRLAIVAKVGSVISIICLILTIIALVIRRRLDMNDDLAIVRTVFHINMSICLLIAQFLFLLGIDHVQYAFDCRTMVILFHYFLLATLSWMFVDGIELIIALKNAFKIDRVRIVAYALYAYGFPSLIVALAISLSHPGHHASKDCWFSYENAFIWAFAIPFVMLILASICFFATFIYYTCKHLTDASDDQGIRSALRDVTTLSILFGLTWLIGLFHLHEQTSLAFTYIFTVLSSFQGLVVFVVFCLLQTHVQRFYLHQLSMLYKKTTSEEKSHQHYNTSSSGYSSAPSSEISKQILSVDPQASFHVNAEYLSSMPTGLLSTFRYPTSPLTLPIAAPEQNEQLLKRHRTDAHHDDHQYYEIG